jgi:hypothetical protein
MISEFTLSIIISMYNLKQGHQKKKIHKYTTSFMGGLPVIQPSYN